MILAACCICVNATENDLTARQYLELEVQPENRHEFLDGEMIWMAGATPLARTCHNVDFERARTAESEDET